jgi:hypothetical protein
MLNGQSKAKYLNAHWFISLNPAIFQFRVARKRGAGQKANGLSK